MVVEVLIHSEEFGSDERGGVVVNLCHQYYNDRVCGDKGGGGVAAR
jgi:hypothetical protein